MALQGRYLGPSEKQGNWGGLPGPVAFSGYP
jgi:hypothetical protein